MKEKLILLKEKATQVIEKVAKDKALYQNKSFKEEIEEMLTLCQELENLQFDDIQDEQCFYLYYALTLRHIGVIYLNASDSDFQNIDLFSKEEKEELKFCIEYFEKCLFCCQKVESLYLIASSEEKKQFETEFAISQEISASVGYPLGLIYIYCNLDTAKGYAYIKDSAQKGNPFSAETMVVFNTHPSNFEIDAIKHYLNILHDKMNLNSLNDLKRYNKLISKVANAYVYQGLYAEALALLDFYEEFLSLSFVEDQQKTELDNFEEIKQLCKSKIEEENSFVAPIQTLEQLFEPEIISLMSEDVKVFLSTAIEIQNFMKEKALESVALDFSPIVVSVAKPLETILFKIIAVDFLEFLRKQEKCKLNNVHELFKTKDRQGNTVFKFYIKELHFTMGSTLEIIVEKETYFDGIEYKPNEYFYQFCKNLGVADCENFILSLHSSLTKIQISRNNAAHKTRFLQSDACEIFNSVIDLIKSLYQNFGILFVNQTEDEV